MRHWIFLVASVLATPSFAGEFWISNEKDNTISVIDETTLEVTRTIEVGKTPARHHLFQRLFSAVHLCASDSDTVQVIDPATGKLLNELAIGRRPGTVCAASG